MCQVDCLGDQSPPCPAGWRASGPSTVARFPPIRLAACQPKAACQLKAVCQPKAVWQPKAAYRRRAEAPAKAG